MMRVARVIRVVALLLLVSTASAPAATAIHVTNDAELGSAIREAKPGTTIRILQERTEPGFVPCRNGLVEKNVIVFRRGDVREPINVGPGTDAKSFVFAGNQWYCEDDPPRSKPNLPSPEIGGTYGIAPKH